MARNSAPRSSRSSPRSRRHLDAPPRLGTLFVVSGPSGVGKGSVVRGLRIRDPSLAYSVSVRTPPPRPGEEDGRDYIFVTPEQFLELLSEGAFLEHAEVFGNRYGTLAGSVEDLRRSGVDVVLEIDVQGARVVRERVPDAVLIFLHPPSFAELERRLRQRGTEDEEELSERLAEAREEMEQSAWFDEVVENDDLETAVAEVAAIIERYRRPT